jgi:hypothetical protein
MALNIDKIEAILREHWHIPSGLSATELHDHASRIQVLVLQKYSHDNLKYQLRLMQTNKLHQEFDDQACDQIASELLAA